jgi:outer membrane protein insertion porin family
LAVIVLALALAFPLSASAQSILSGGTIQEVRIEGTQRVDPETVQTYMTVNPGDPFDATELDNSLKSLFATGFFADVTLRREGDALIVSVVENPVINRIAFEGNQRIEDNILQAEITLRPRVVFTRTRAQNDVQRILDIYRRSGRFAASVEPKVIKLPQNRVDLVFEISEGEHTGIQSINFIGNQVFSDSTLRGEITTEETAFWRFFSSSDTYDPDRMAFDRELLRRFYLSEGYADFRVVSAVAELSEDRTGFILTFTVEEGPRYTFGAVELTTTLRNFDPETLREQIEIEEGDWYDADVVEDTKEQLTRLVGNYGYAFVEVRPRTDRDRDNLTIGLTFEILEGPKVFVERIDIQGNSRTLDKVIRREFLLVEGDAFNATKLQWSRRRIENLGFFRSVNVDTERTDVPDRTLITVEVEEQSTGELTFGAGLSTTVGPIGNIQLRERNLLGRGQDLRLTGTIAGKASEIDLSFTEPYFLDRNVSAGFDIYRTSRDQDESSLTVERFGGTLRTGYNLTRSLRQSLFYTLENREVTNVDEDASEAAKAEEGESLRSIIGQALIWDRRNRRFNTSEGYVIRLRNSLAGLGGDVSYLKNVLSGFYYFPVAEQVTLVTGAEFGYMFGIDEDTGLSDRFFLGGESFRGFESGGIGPRDEETGDSVGGEKYYKGTVELRFPLGLPEAFDIQGHLFTDFGSLWDSGGAPGDILDSDSIRVSVGPGFFWNSPFGPVNVDFGFPVVEEDFDKDELLVFSFGTQF